MNRRRSVMGPPTDKTRSKLPVPGSSIKTQMFGDSLSGPKSKRMSLAGGMPQRGPRASIIAPPGSIHRQSIYRGPGNPLLQSTSKPGIGIGKTPMKPVRRGSMWPGAAGSSSQPHKDPREIRSREFQARMKSDISAVLNSTDFEIHKSIWNSITGKDYRAIFEHLVQLVDPNYPFTPSARLDDQFMQALRSLHYPFVHSLDAKWLAAPASMHSWPALLAVLHWLAEMFKMRSHYLESGHSTLQNVDEIPEEFDAEDHHVALALEYYTVAYQLYLEGHDLFPEQDQVMEDRYRKKNARIQEDLDEKRNQLQKEQLEYEKMLRSAPRLKTIQEENQAMRKDDVKLQEMVKHSESRKTKLQMQIEFEREKITNQEAMLRRLWAERDRLEGIVQAQNLSPDEVIRMNTDHDMLTRQLNELKRRLNDAEHLIMSLEVQVSRSASTVEDGIDDYNKKLNDLDLYSPAILPDFNEPVDLHLELNPAASDPAKLLLGQDVRTVIQPALDSVMRQIMQAKDDIQRQIISLEHDVQMLTAEAENLQLDLFGTERQAKTVSDEAENIRDAINRDTASSQAELLELQERISAVKTASETSGSSAKSRLKNLEIAYKEQVERVKRLKEDTVRDILKNSSAMDMFKKDMEAHLQSLKDVADAN